MPSWLSRGKKFAIEFLVNARQWTALRRAGASWSSILAAVRRRKSPDSVEFSLANGIRFACPGREPAAQIFYNIWVRRLYDREELRAGTVVDIGAHAGLFALKIAAENPGTRVVAVEPSPRMFRYLERNIAANGMSNIVAVQAACGGSRGRATLYARGLEEANTLYDHDVFGSTFRAMADVEVLTLQALFDRFSITSCEVLKLNCEGAEYEILLNAPAAILRQVRKIGAQYHVGMNAHDPSELSEHLRVHGFQVEVTPRTSLESGFLYARR